MVDEESEAGQPLSIPIEHARKPDAATRSIPCIVVGSMHRSTRNPTYQRARQGQLACLHACSSSFHHHPKPFLSASAVTIWPGLERAGACFAQRKERQAHPSVAGLASCFALLCFALLCFALLCFALLCFALVLAWLYFGSGSRRALSIAPLLAYPSATHIPPPCATPTFPLTHQNIYSPSLSPPPPLCSLAPSTPATAPLPCFFSK